MYIFVLVIRIVKNISLFLVVSMLILATGGFSIFHHICNCAGEMSVSIFTEATCSQGKASPSCCPAKELPACCTIKKVQQSTKVCHEKDCCHNSEQFFKINDSFQPGIAKNIVKPDIQSVKIILIEALSILNEAPPENVFTSDLPPPETGRQIILKLHRLKLDTHQV